MRKHILFLAVLFLLCFLAGCKPSDIQLNNGQAGTAAVQDGSEQLEAKPIQIHAVKTLKTSPITFRELYPDTVSRFEIEHYRAHPQGYDPVSYARDYIDALDLPSGVTDAFAEDYRNAEQVKTFPVYGTNLENTDLIAYVFYHNEAPTSITLMRINAAGTGIEFFESCPLAKIPHVITPLSAADCGWTLVDCLERYPDFNVVGFVFESYGYSAVYPIGINAGEETMQYICEGPTDFSRVEPFSTVEEGRAAMLEYVAWQQTLKSELIVYPWTDTEFYTQGYMNVFRHTYVKPESSAMDLSYLQDYDSCIAIPLLDSSLQEDVYVLHLLYYRDQLIGELVIKREGSNGAFSYIPVWENTAVKNDDGTYIPISESSYMQAVSSAQAADIAWSDQAVVFDGQFIPVGYIGNELSYYDTAASTLVTVE